MTRAYRPPRTRPFRDMARLFWAGLQYPGEAATCIATVAAIGLILGVLG